MRERERRQKVDPFFLCLFFPYPETQKFQVLVFSAGTLTKEPSQSVTNQHFALKLLQNKYQLLTTAIAQILLCSMTASFFFLFQGSALANFVALNLVLRSGLSLNATDEQDRNRCNFIPCVHCKSRQKLPGLTLTPVACHSIVVLIDALLSPFLFQIPVNAEPLSSLFMSYFTADTIITKSTENSLLVGFSGTLDSNLLSSNRQTRTFLKTLYVFK